MAVIENVSTEIGDVMRIFSDVPIVGILTLNNFIDDTEGEQIIDGDVVNIATTQLSNDLSGKATYINDIIIFNQSINQTEIGLLDIQKDALELGKTYKLVFTIEQNTSRFLKVNLYHSNESAIIQYSAISIGQTVNVLCLITPIVSDSESNKPLRITLSNVEIVNGDAIEIKGFALNEVSTTSRYFKKEFRYSVDAGLNFTGWQDLNNVNVQNIVVSRRDQFLVEVKLTRTGLNATGELVFNSLNIQGIYSQLPYPIYQKTFFNEFFTVNDIGVLNWQINVLEKLYKTGITPWYIERDTGEEEAIEIQPPTPTYTVSSIVTNGTVNDDSITVTQGDSIVVVFTPDANSYFSTLTVNGQPYNNYNLNENGTLTVSLTNIQENKDLSVTYEVVSERVYGALYNWYAVDESKTNGGFISGFTVPTSDKWVTLGNYLGGAIIAGGKLKSTRTYPTVPPRWKLPNTGATDEFNFYGVASGRRLSDGTFSRIGEESRLMIDIAENSLGDRPYRRLNFNSSSLGWITSTDSGKLGLSVRLVRDVYVSEQALVDGSFLTPVQDFNGNTYKVVKIGTQAWTVENLIATNFANGTPIPNVTDNTDWSNLTTGAYCWYNNA
jgi:uncharacterized protein (TIGR02145 family)